MLVVGAGPVVARKAAALVAQGAVVTVVALRHSADMDAVGVAVRRTEEFRRRTSTAPGSSWPPPA